MCSMSSLFNYVNSKPRLRDLLQSTCSGISWLTPCSPLARLHSRTIGTETDYQRMLMRKAFRSPVVCFIMQIHSLSSRQLLHSFQRVNWMPCGQYLNPLRLSTLPLMIALRGRDLCWSNANSFSAGHTNGQAVMLTRSNPRGHRRGLALFHSAYSSHLT